MHHSASTGYLQILPTLKLNDPVDLQKSNKAESVEYGI